MKQSPIRRGLAKNLTLDPDAAVLLEIIAVGKGAQGRMLSELIRTRARELAERPALLERLRTVCATLPSDAGAGDPGSPSGAGPGSGEG